MSEPSETGARGGTGGVADLAAQIARGAVSARQVADHFLDQIEARDDEVMAFAHVDPERVRRQADALDAHRKSGRPLGRLHGLPVALKDIIDTADMPTENGTEIDAERRPERDAALVARLRRAGAVVLGKTVTTELAFMAPSETRNPHDLARSPGGSSAGSAAAVAAGMAPLAVGTQTGGSIIRPASYCGVVGVKPSFGLVPRTGVLAEATELDTIGPMARSVADAALLLDAMQGHDAGDPDSLDIAPLPCAATVAGDPPARPLLAFVEMPGWEDADADVRGGFGELREALGEACDAVALPDLFAEAIPAQRTLQMVGIARHFARYGRAHAEALSPQLRDALAEGAAIPATEYLRARDWTRTLRAGLDRVFERYDAILCPAAPGEAPRLEEGTTGDPIFCSPWTLLGLPAVTLPLLTGDEGLPVGVQLVGRYLDDHRLLRTADWLVNALTEGQNGEIS